MVSTNHDVQDFWNDHNVYKPIITVSISTKLFMHKLLLRLNIK